MYFYLSISFLLFVCLAMLMFYFTKKKRILCVVLWDTFPYSHCHTPRYHHQTNLNIQQNNFMFNTFTFFARRKRSAKKKQTHIDWHAFRYIYFIVFFFSCSPSFSIHVAVFLCVFFILIQHFCVRFSFCLVSVQHFHRLMACHKNAWFQHIKMHGCR